MSIQDTLLKGVEYQQQGMLEKAAEIYQRMLHSHPAMPEPYHLLGLIEYHAGNFDRALTLINRAIELDPAQGIFRNSIANIYQDLGQLDSAIKHYEAAIALDRSPEFLNNLGTARQANGQWQAALELFKAALALNPAYAEAAGNIGDILRSQHDLAQALIFYKRALAVRADYVEAWLHRGITEQGLQLYPDACFSYNKVLSIEPDNHYALNNMSQTLRLMGDRVGALNCCIKALHSGQNQIEIASNALKLSQELLQWDLTEKLRHFLLQNSSGAKQIDPFTLLTGNFPDIFRKSHYQFHSRAVAPSKPAEGNAAPLLQNSRRIKIGYLSANIGNHAVGLVIQDLFQHHNPDQFEVTLFSLNKTIDDISRHVSGRVEHFIDVSAKNDLQIVETLAAHNLDILVDMMGYTTGCRSEVLASRPAPIQISFLGFLDTMQADFIDYLVVDRTIVTDESQRRIYSENLIYMPDSFTAFSQFQQVDRSKLKSEYGFASGTLFCCFNSLYKIDKDVVDAWCEILQQCPHSSLWLINDEGENVELMLSGYMLARGIDTKRLIFSRKLPIEEHLQRSVCADLFLDTFHYNAGATAAMSYWAGVPVLTKPGHTFVSRIGASFAHSMKLDQLVAKDIDEYVRKAVAIGNSADRQRALKADVLQRLDSSAAFDMKRFAQALERAYKRVLEVHPNHEDVYL